MLATILWYENGDKIISLCEAEERDDAIYLMLDHSIAAMFKLDGIREIERDIPEERLTLDFPLKYFIWQQYDRLGKCQFVWPAWPLEKPIGEEDDGMDI